VPAWFCRFLDAFGSLAAVASGGRWQWHAPEQHSPPGPGPAPEPAARGTGDPEAFDASYFPPEDPVIVSQDTPPFLLYAEAQIVSPADLAGPPVAIPTGKLTNPLNVPVEVREIHFTLRSEQVGSDDYAVRRLIADLRVGRRVIAEHAPLFAVCWRDLTDRFESRVQTAGGFIGADTVRWVLPRPLILAPGEGVGGQIAFDPLLDYTGEFERTTTIGVLLRGRRLPLGTPVPRVRALPYASGWIFQRPGEISPEQAFRNIFNVPLNVTSLNVAPAYRDATVNQEATVQIVGHGGLVATGRRELAPVVPAVALGAGRQALEVAHRLDPSEGYKVTATALLDVGGGVYEPLAMALSGYREEN
jgi:hypothetical protein